jgi:hypothetical protein
VKDTERAAVALLASTPAVLRAMLSGLPEEMVSAELDRDWSVKRYVAHLLDVEQAAFGERMRRIVSGEVPQFEVMDPMPTLEGGGYMERTLASLLEEFEGLRRENCAWLGTLGDEQLARKGKHATAGEVSASNLLHYWPTHDMAHVRHIQRMLGAVLLHEMGNAKEWDI